MSRHISATTTLEGLKKEAKRWLKQLRAGDTAARRRFEEALASAPATPTLRDVQHALAREHGLSGWSALRLHVAAPPRLRAYEVVAIALVNAYRTGSPDDMRVVWDYFGHMRAWEAMRHYVRLDLGRSEEPLSADEDIITIDDAQLLVARAQGFTSWSTLVAAVHATPDKASLAIKSVSAYASGTHGQRAAIQSRDWDEVIDRMRQQSLTRLHAAGQMTDAILERVVQLDHITSLDLEGSRTLTDEGLRLLARLPHLSELILAGCTGISDRGVDVLRALPGLRCISLAFTPVTDRGAAHLRACTELRVVDLSGTRTGDDAIRALSAKTYLHEFRSGMLVSDAGFVLLHELPVFKTWRGGEANLSLLSPNTSPNFLMLRGHFTDHGLAQLRGLDGLFSLNIDDAKLAISGAGLAPLAQLPNLQVLAVDATDESMPFIAALPGLRFLLCQDTTASDDGFVALSKSHSIEYLWGRRCYNLQRRGFTALADMPALAALAVSCKNVDEVGLSALPHFPVLKELMPMDVPDDGYRHVAKCAQLDSLVLMYCRETTDAATEHIAQLPALRKYFASYNRISDRTPQLLSGITSLEEVTFDSCSRLTNAGIRCLARLPRLRRLNVSGMPNVTADVVGEVGTAVEVRYAP